MIAGRRRLWRLPISLAASVLIVLLGAVAALNLWSILSARQRSFHLASGVSSMERGRAMVQRMAAFPSLAQEYVDPHSWNQFAALLDALGALEDGLVSVAIEEDGSLLFQGHPRSTQDVDADNDPAGPDYVRMAAGSAATTNGIARLLVFSKRIPLPSGAERQIKLTMRRNVPDGCFNPQITAAEDFFRVPMAVFIATILACLILMLVVLRFDRTHQDRFRRQEQLVLAGAITGGILHDFKNPLSALILDAQLLQKELQKGKTADIARASDLARRLQEVLARLNALFGEASLLARPESTQAKFYPVDLKRCLQESAALAQPRIAKAGLELETTISEGPALVWGEQGLLTRAVLNLLLNAEQHSPSNGKIALSLKSEAGQITVEVADYGLGIARKDRKRVFDMFFSRRPGGAGLGLFLARAAVEDCGGTIRLGESDAGARFIVTFPAMANQYATADEKAHTWQQG